MLEFLEIVFKIVFVAVVLALAGFVLTAIAAAYIGIAQALRRNTKPEALASREPAVDVTKFVLIPIDVFARWQKDNPAAAATIVAATASPVPEGDVASDEELKKLRRARRSRRQWRHQWLSSLNSGRPIRAATRAGTRTWNLIR